MKNRLFILAVAVMLAAPATAQRYGHPRNLPERHVYNCVTQLNFGYLRDFTGGGGHRYGAAVLESFPIASGRARLDVGLGGGVNRRYDDRRFSVDITCGLSRVRYIGSSVSFRYGARAGVIWERPLAGGEGLAGGFVEASPLGLEIHTKGRSGLLFEFLTLGIRTGGLSLREGVGGVEAYGSLGVRVSLMIFSLSG